MNKTTQDPWSEINMHRANPYCRQEAIDICSWLEPYFAAKGMHLALGGSLLYRGTSTKDIDILVYPHNAKAGEASYITEGEVRKIITEFGFKEIYPLDGESFTGSSAIPGVIVTAHVHQQTRVDFILLARPAAVHVL
jgi:hypothetical protein